MNKFIILGMFLALAACAPQGGDQDEGKQESEVGGGPWKQVDAVKRADVLGGELVAKVAGREVVAVISWRAYDRQKDGAVGKWYGDMGLAQPDYVVDRLVVAVDGKGLSIPSSKYRNLCSIGMNDSKANPMSLNQQGGKLRLLVDVGDGGEGYSSVYILDPAAGKLVAHYVDSGPAVFDQIVQ